MASTTPPSQWEPLYLSTIAGLSTCIGAAVVFCQPQNENSNAKIVPPHTMAFSLALAGSVMVTVSVVSILPEVLMDDSSSRQGGGEGSESESYQMIEIFSWEMLCRILFFVLGSGLYFGLSSCFHVPEPEEVLDTVLLGGNRSADEDGITENPHSVDDEEGGTESSPSDREMVPLVSSSHLSISESESFHIGDGTEGSNVKSSTPPLLRGRKNNLSNKAPDVRSPSPGDNNGKVKLNSHSPARNNNNNKKGNNHNHTVTTSANSNVSAPMSFSAWTTGEDLKSHEEKKAWRVAILLFVSLLVHNFPEGLAVAASALESTKLGVTVTVGIMIHNIPEGIAIAIPCLAARPDKPWLSFILASISGLAEPAGAFVALLFLKDVNKKGDRQDDDNSNNDNEGFFMNLENILSFVAGIMVMVALWELFPEAKRHASQTMKYFWYGTVLGIIVMVLTEVYLP